MAKLYEITGEYNDLLLMAEEEGLTHEQIKDTLDGIEFEFEEKADSIAKLIRTLTANADAVKEEKERLAKREKTARNSAESLKKYLEAMMIATDKKKFKTTLFSFGIQKNAPSLKIEVEDLVPEEYLIKQPDKVDKKRLLNDLKEGIIVANENMRIVQTESLRIR